MINGVADSGRQSLYLLLWHFLCVCTMHPTEAEVLLCVTTMELEHHSPIFFWVILVRPFPISCIKYLPFP